MLIDLTRETVLRPRQFLARLLAMNLEPAIRWQIFAAVVVVSALGSHLFLWALSGGGGPLLELAPTPLTSGIVQAVLLLVMALAAHLVGRGFGGTGNFPDALLAMSVAQGVMVVFQVLQIVVLLISVRLAEVVGFVSVALFFWILANFLMELHGFTSLPKVVIGLITAMFGIALAFGLLLTAMGLPTVGV